MITRHILHPDIRLMIYDKEWDYTQLCKHIDRAKSYLIHERGARPGQKVLLVSSSWPSYLAWFMACSELGLSFLISDSLNMDKCPASVLHKISLYGEIHHMIGDRNHVYYKHVPHLHDRFIDHKEWFNYPISETPIWATRESVLIYSTTSGTTNVPKVCSHTHGFYYDLMIRNANVLELKENDLCLHNKGLHHGSVAGVYFLPSLYRCRYHRWCEHDKIIDTIQTYGVNRVLLFYDNIDKLRDQMIPTIKQDNLTLYVLSAVPKDIVDLVVGRMNHTIVSVYGCTETSGPVMLSTAKTIDWNPLSFDGPLDNFYDLSIDADGILTIGMPDGMPIKPGDKFAIVDGKWILKGRENFYRIKGQTIYLGVLADWIETKYGWKNQESFDLVFDHAKSCIYIRVDPDLIDSIDTLNSDIASYFDDTYRIACMVTGLRYDFYSGIKFDGNEVRLRCREHS